jgi:hypothetical protein
MLLGQCPNPRVILVTTLIALDALAPGAYFDFEVSGQFRAVFVSVPAVWVWLTAIAVNAVLGLNIKNRHEVDSRQPPSVSKQDGGPAVL